MKTSILPAFLTAISLASAGFAADAPKPLKVLLLAGGCCHDYATQKAILKKGLEERANVKVEVIYTADYPVGANGKPDATKPKFSIYGNPDYAKGFDVVLHDECSAGIADPAVIQGVLKPHMDGIPGVNLHCAMHSYRFGEFKNPVAPGAENSHWYEYLGLQSTGHGPQEPIAITFTAKDSSIVKGFADWTTMKEELYNNIQILTGRELAMGKQTVKNKDGTTKDVETVVAWTNEYGPRKTRVFSTTIGHNNATVEDPRYLDLVTRGLLWSAGKLGDDGFPAKGYGPGGK
ncbi:MAG: ThuA domain-containing protein [Chthoniobacteraceae bacterium]